MILFIVYIPNLPGKAVALLNRIIAQKSKYNGIKILYSASMKYNTDFVMRYIVVSGADYQATVDILEAQKLQYSAFDTDERAFPLTPLNLSRWASSIPQATPAALSVSQDYKNTSIAVKVADASTYSVIQHLDMTYDYAPYQGEDRKVEALEITLPIDPILGTFFRALAGLNVANDDEENAETYNFFVCMLGHFETYRKLILITEYAEDLRYVESCLENAKTLAPEIITWERQTYLKCRLTNAGSGVADLSGVLTDFFAAGINIDGQILVPSTIGDQTLNYAIF